MIVAATLSSSLCNSRRGGPGFTASLFWTFGYPWRWRLFCTDVLVWWLFDVDSADLEQDYQQVHLLLNSPQRISELYVSTSTIQLGRLQASRPTTLQIRIKNLCIVTMNPHIHIVGLRIIKKFLILVSTIAFVRGLLESIDYLDIYVPQFNQLRLLSASGGMLFTETF
jgi:hypothetical protein